MLCTVRSILGRQAQSFGLNRDTHPILDPLRLADSHTMLTILGNGRTMRSHTVPEHAAENVTNEKRKMNSHWHTHTLHTVAETTTKTSTTEFRRWIWMPMTSRCDVDDELKDEETKYFLKMVFANGLFMQTSLTRTGSSARVPSDANVHVLSSVFGVRWAHNHTYTVSVLRLDNTFGTLDLLQSSWATPFYLQICEYSVYSFIILGKCCALESRVGFPHAFSLTLHLPFSLYRCAKLHAHIQ